MNIETLKKAKDLCNKKERLENDLKNTGYEPDEVFQMVSFHCGDDVGQKFRNGIEESGRRILEDKLKDIHLAIQEL